MKKFVNLIKILLVLVLSVILSAIVVGSFIGFTGMVGGNILTSSNGKIIFDPVISITYLLVYYFLVMFYQPTVKNQHQLFIFTLLLSFSMQFTQGSFALIFCFYLLRKGKFI